MKAPAGSAGPVLSRGTLVYREEVARSIYLLDFRLEGGDASGTLPAPGNFYNVDCGGGREHLLPRPLSAHGLYGGGEQGLVVRFLVEEVGWGTGRLCESELGTHVGMLGPLGRGFEPAADGRALLVSGGIGVAPLHFLASRMEAEGLAYDFLAGFRDSEHYYPALGDLAGSLEVYTDDGSMGRGGPVSAGAAASIEKGEYSSVYACGPEAMMRAVANIAESSGVPCQVSLDSRMACGVGSCRGCVRPGRAGANICVCLDGPVFDSVQVEWKGSDPDYDRCLTPRRKGA